MNKNKWIKYSISLLFFMLPILDMVRSTSLKDVQLFGFACVELVNIVLIGIAFILTLSKQSKKQWILPFSYIAIILVYCVLHYKNIVLFDTGIYTKANFNLLIETYYIGRAYCLPITMLYILVMNKDVFNRTFYESVFKYVAFFISASILILNVTKLSYRSYNLTNTPIPQSVIEFLIHPVESNFKALSSRGWFHSANEISAILFAIFPMNLYLFYRDFKWDNVLLYLIQFLTMITLGTRTAAVGSLLISGLCFMGYLFLSVIHKKKLLPKIIAVSAMIFGMNLAYFTVSPFLAGYNEEQNNMSKMNANATTFTREEITPEIFMANLSKFKIKQYFLDQYPLEDDYEWWLDRTQDKPSENADNRAMKQKMLTRMKQRNNNPGDDLYGLGYTLNYVDIEVDYVSQYLLYGIFGVIFLIGPYLLAVVYCLLNFICHIQYRFNLLNMCSFMAALLMLVIAYLSGHVFGMVSPSMVLALSIGNLWTINLRKGEPEIE